MSMKLLGYRKRGPGVYEPFYIEGPLTYGLPFRKDPCSQKYRGLFNPWGGTVRDSKVDESKLATKTIYIKQTLEEGGGFRVEYNFGG